MRVEVHSRIAIDICPWCEGVWLDAGELDAVRKILVRRKAIAIKRRESAKEQSAGNALGDFMLEVIIQFIIGALDGC